MATGENVVARVLKFDGKNFQHWKFQITAALVANELLGIVDGTEPRPNNLNDEEGKRWIKRDGQARYLMSTAIQLEQMENLYTCITSHEMWEKLTEIHEQKTHTHKLLLSQRFHEYRMEPTSTVVQHIPKVQNLARQLIDIGENIPDLVIMSKILDSLPLKYRHFRTSWGVIEPDRQTLELLQSRLIERKKV